MIKDKGQRSELKNAGVKPEDIFLSDMDNHAKNIVVTHEEINKFNATCSMKYGIYKFVNQL